jgi:hypothetical protein
MAFGDALGVEVGVGDGLLVGEVLGGRVRGGVVLGMGAGVSTGLVIIRETLMVTGLPTEGVITT